MSAIPTSRPRPTRRLHPTSVVLDMTPFVDVAFLLVTFFLLTAQFVPEEPQSVKLPESTGSTEEPMAAVATILVTKAGEVYYSGHHFRGQHQWDALNYSAVGGSNNALSTWLARERRLNSRVQIAIKADEGVPYPLVKQIIQTLQHTGIYRFHLMTNTKHAGNVRP